MSQLESLPKDLADCMIKLPLHDLMCQITLVNALNKETEELLWHEQLIHGGDHKYDTIHKHVNDIPNILFEFKFDDLTKCSTCLCAKLTQAPAGHTSLCNKLKFQYQGLYVDLGFQVKFNIIKKEK